MSKAFLNWSSGKDAAFSLYKIQQQKEFEVHRLVTTVNSQTNRVSMHGLRIELLKQQAEKIGIPLQLIALDGNIGMEEYSRIMAENLQKLKQEGFTQSIFGDIFLEDLKEYRENQLNQLGVKARFPLWGRHTSELMQEFLAAGFKAITVSVNASLLDKSFCGRILDQSFLSDLPPHVDPCGENGEFHTFVFDGPIFKNPVKFSKAEIVEKSYVPAKGEDDNCFSDEQKSWDTRFYYCDLLLSK